MESMMRDYQKRRNVKFFPGRMFGSLELISVNRDTNKAMLSCTNCGKIVEYYVSHLSAGNKTDCGCLGSQNNWVYFISITGYTLGLDFNLVKIGRTADGGLGNRVSVTKTHTPFEVEVVNQVMGPTWLEKWMHDHFAPLRIFPKREWFWFTEEMRTIKSPIIPPTTSNFDEIDFTQMQ